MENIDLTTAGGIAAAALIIIETLKKIFVNYELKLYPWYPSALNLLTLILAFGLSFASIMINPDVALYEVIGNAIMGFLLAIGGYEPIVNLIRGILKKSNK